MTKIEFILTNKTINLMSSNAISQEGKDFDDDCKPMTAKNFISKEYVDLPKMHDNDLRNSTVKKCMPFLDAMTSGYIIPFYQDYLITELAEKEGVEVTSGLHKMYFHNFNQLPENYQETKAPIGKFSNKWIIRTPPGYSCLFTHPMNQPKTDFEIISGIVDTDVFESAVLFPYYWKRYAKDYSKGKLQVHIKKGDPMVQVIPFKRENWSSWVGKKESYKKSQTTVGLLLDAYKKYYWKRKKYN